MAAIAAPQRKLYGLQFHPEVVHTARGKEYLANFLFRVCGCRKDWNPRHRVPMLEREIRECVGDRNVFFFVSAGWIPAWRSPWRRARWAMTACAACTSIRA